MITDYVLKWHTVINSEWQSLFICLGINIILRAFTLNGKRKQFAPILESEFFSFSQRRQNNSE